MGLDSYDRLFPNQDTLPKGGRQPKQLAGIPDGEERVLIATGAILVRGLKMSGWILVFSNAYMFKNDQNKKLALSQLSIY
ncbi:MAG: hypothetical protein JG781_414 [Peptococcaceae bacterium]|nr:hypothetical protein [Peptococcaceae bacterium]